MLHQFLNDNRAEILLRSRARVGLRLAPKPTEDELTLGIPLFLDELVAILTGKKSAEEKLDEDATRHGEVRQQMGFTVAQVVHDYGDLCQVVTQLAIESEAQIDTEEFKTLNRCLDDAIAQAVTEHARLRERSIAENEVQRLGFLAHELRNHLHTANLAFEILKSGSVGIGGSTGAVLRRSLLGLQRLVDRTLAQVRLESGLDRPERLDITNFLEEMEAAGSIEAKERGVALTVLRGNSGVAVEADRQLLGSAVSNLLQNAIKFTHPNGHVHLLSTSTPDRVAIEVGDECGGLRPGQAEQFFAGTAQTGKDRSGLGLLISQRAVEAMGGTVQARNRPGLGCVFTIELPRLRRSSDSRASGPSHQGTSSCGLESGR